MTIWTDLGFRKSLYEVDPVPATAEGEELLVGRDAELAELQMYLSSSVTHSTIEGPNGVGKSSLVALAEEGIPFALERDGVALEHFVPAGESIAA